MRLKSVAFAENASRARHSPVLTQGTGCAAFLNLKATIPTFAQAAETAYTLEAAPGWDGAMHLARSGKS